MKKFHRSVRSENENFHGMLCIGGWDMPKFVEKPFEAFLP